MWTAPAKRALNGSQHVLAADIHNELHMYLQQVVYLLKISECLWSQSLLSPTHHPARTVE